MWFWDSLGYAVSDTTSLFFNAVLNYSFGILITEKFLHEANYMLDHPHYSSR